ncbi:MAG: hypothetical protein AAF974_08330 [Cyanobacteria bacterium P01_E01_bin.34]
MIPKENMMAVLIKACPSFEPEWERFCDEWQDDDSLSLYISLGDFARHLISLLNSGNIKSFSDVFDAIERLHVDGDEYVRKAATIGILENIQNITINSKADPEQFCPFLQPESRRWWNKLHYFWNTGKPLEEDCFLKQ